MYSECRYIYVLVMDTDCDSNIWNIFTYRNPLISTINGFQKSVVLSKFRVKRSKKIMMMKVMRVRIQTVFYHFCLFLHTGTNFKQQINKLT